MTKKDQALAKLKNWLQQTEETNPNKPNKKIYVFVILAAGITFMMISNLLPKNQLSTSNANSAHSTEKPNETVEVFGKEKNNPLSSMIDYEKYYENELKKALDSIVGVQDVSIVINVAATEKKVFEKNIAKRNQITNEIDANGGKRQVEDQSEEEQMVLIREGDREVPLISETKKPEIVGVLVVAKGAEQIHVKKMILEACMRVLDVPSHRISVLAKK